MESSKRCQIHVKTSVKSVSSASKRAKEMTQKSRFRPAERKLPEAAGTGRSPHDARTPACHGSETGEEDGSLLRNV